ncbi:MAG: hypothetical protein AAFY20_04880 [Cyanobacteria bacterium J06639_14]
MLLTNPSDLRILPESSGCGPWRLADPIALPEREQLRHLIIGSPEGVRSTIHTLHVLNYAEQLRWSQLITIPTSGLMITPRQGEVMSFLIRHWQLS